MRERLLRRRGAGRRSGGGGGGGGHPRFEPPPARPPQNADGERRAPGGGRGWGPPPPRGGFGERWGPPPPPPPRGVQRCPAEQGALLTGRVQTIVPYGAWVILPALPPDLRGRPRSGLVHVSEIRPREEGRVEDVGEVLKAGQEIRVVVLEVYVEAGDMRGPPREKIRLSMAGADQDTGKLKEGYRLPPPRFSGPRGEGDIGKMDVDASGRSAGERMFSNRGGSGAGAGAGAGWRQGGRFKSKPDYFADRAKRRTELRVQQDGGKTWRDNDGPLYTEQHPFARSVWGRSPSPEAANQVPGGGDAKAKGKNQDSHASESGSSRNSSSSSSTSGTTSSSSEESRRRHRSRRRRGSSSRGRKHGRSRKRRRSPSSDSSTGSSSGSSRSSSSASSRDKRRHSGRDRRRRRRSYSSSKDSIPTKIELEVQNDDSGSGNEKNEAPKEKLVSAVARSAELADKDKIGGVEFERENEVGSDSDDDMGPMPLPQANAGGGTAASSANAYGGALLPGEGEAIAQYVQQNLRIPRRGEIGYSQNEIETYEKSGYVMSGSRHARMNAVRLRKENQVYSAEEQRALALITMEENQQKEAALIQDFRVMLEEKKDAKKRKKDRDGDA